MSTPHFARCRAVLLPSPRLAPVTRAIGTVVVLMVLLLEWCGPVNGRRPHRLLPKSARLRPVIDLGDEAGAAIAREINPQPAQRHGQTIAQADQKINVRQAPYPPGEPAADFEPSEVDDRRALADGREIAGVPVAKRAVPHIALE